MNTPQAHSFPPDQSFSPEERLFRAVQVKHVQDGTTVLADAIQLPSLSCNREKYRDFPEAVLAIFSHKPEDCYLYVAILSAVDMPPPKTADGKVFWELFPEHIPEEENYSHTEIRARRCGKDYNPEVKINSKVKMELKAFLAGKMRVIPRYGPTI